MTASNGYRPSRYNDGFTDATMYIQDLIDATNTLDTAAIPSRQRIVWYTQDYQVPVEKRDILFKDGLDESPSRL